MKTLKVPSANTIVFVDNITHIQGLGDKSSVIHLTSGKTIEVDGKPLDLIRTINRPETIQS